MILLLLNVGYDLLKRKSFIFDKSIFLLVYFLILCLTFFYSEELNLGVKMIVKSLPFLLIPLGLLTTSKVSNRQLNILSIGFFLGNITTIIISFIYGVVVFKNNPLPLKNGFSYFTSYVDIHPSYFSIFILYSVLLLFWNNRNNKDFTNFKKLIIFISLIAIQLYLKSRAGLLATTIIFLVYSFLHLKKRGLYLILLIPIVLITVFKKDDFLNRNTSGSIEDRVRIWESSIEVIENNLLLGVGIGDYQFELDKQYYLNSFDHGINDRLNCHNQYLQTFVTSGILGILSLLSVFTALLYRAIKNKNEIILYFLISVSILMFFDSVLVRQHGILFFTFFSTILLKYKSE
nr:O-antigen ligase family protein [uncultured Lacinutrix sp.]